MKDKILTIICILFGLLFINAGLNKFLNYMPPPPDLPEPVVQMNMNMMAIGWLMPLVAIAELIGGILMIPKRTRALGAIIIFPVMIGIMITHLTVEPTGLPMAVVLALILIWVMVENRSKYLALVR